MFKCTVCTQGSSTNVYSLPTIHEHSYHQSNFEKHCSLFSFQISCVDCHTTRVVLFSTKKKITFHFRQENFPSYSLCCLKDLGKTDKYLSKLYSHRSALAGKSNEDHLSDPNKIEFSKVQGIFQSLPTVIPFLQEMCNTLRSHSTWKVILLESLLVKKYPRHLIRLKLKKQ